MGFQLISDWYRLKARDFYDNYGSGLLTHYYQGVPLNAVKEVFPVEDWKEWLFAHVPGNFWDDEENRRRFARWLGEELGFQRIEDWYGVDTEMISQYGGSGLLQSCYRNSPVALVMGVFPEHEWKEWLFESCPQRFWDSHDNRIRYLAWLGGQLGFRDYDDWYRVTAKDFRQHRGSTLLRRFGGSPATIIKAHFPNHDWKEWLFRSIPTGFWHQRVNRKRYVKWLGKQLGFQKPSDWYRLRPSDFRAHRGKALWERFYSPSIERAVRELYPKRKWKAERFVS